MEGHAKKRILADQHMTGSSQKIAL